MVGAFGQVDDAGDPAAEMLRHGFKVQ